MHALVQENQLSARKTIPTRPTFGARQTKNILLVLHNFHASDTMTAIETFRTVKRKRFVFGANENFIADMVSMSTCNNLNVVNKIIIEILN